MCAGTELETFPRTAAAARVVACVELAPEVYSLVLERSLPESPVTAVGERLSAPRCGQFFMLRSRPSGVLLGRPISVYRSDDKSITFLILRKGAGTAELCAARTGDLVDVIGPIGNRFLTPAELLADGAIRRDATPGQPGSPSQRAPLRVAVVGGGIGIAPVAGFALQLPPQSFEFYASFRSATYGLESLSEHAARLTITTEDGSVGVKGMLPAVFKAADYDLVYACGPTPMLRYVQQACAAAEHPPLAFLSLEEHMACGAGACLGCTVRTIAGNRRCCVDGPVFNAAEVLL